MLICVHKLTKRILEMQSNATPGTLFQNAINAGYLPGDIEEKIVDEIGYATAVSKDPVEIAAREARAQEVINQENKARFISDSLPSWSDLQTSIQNINNLSDAKLIMLKLAKIVYWDVKNSEN